MRQWYLRITDYADRLLEGLETVEFSDSMKEMQRNWIGKSSGAEIDFIIKTTDDGQQTTEGQPPSSVAGGQLSLRVYTTRPDTIFGVDFMVVAPELDLVQQIKTPEQTAAVDEYIAYVKSRSDVDRMAEKKITGCFTGAYAVNPFDDRKIPVWISEYVLAGYGTGAIMAVPCGDERDFKFAQHYNIPITNIIGKHFNGEEANATKEAILENSGFLNGIKMMDAAAMVLQKLEAANIGKRKVNYRMRDAGFSRQRYWGEPFPVIWSDGIAIPLDADELPLELPHVDKYGPGKEGEGPLSNLTDWVEVSNGRRETSTMPGYAGSSWYFLRYMDPNNTETFCDRKASDYWNQVDLYIGGTEHAVGHLLYSRMLTKVLYDLGLIGFDEPFRKLLNQGMIQGSSRFVYRVVIKSNNDTEIELKMHPIIVSSKHYINFKKGELTFKEIQEAINKKSTTTQFGILRDSINYEIDIVPKHININMVDGFELKIEEFRKDILNKEFSNAVFVLEDWSISFPEDMGSKFSGKYICGSEVEKMSKSKLNTENPDELCDKYGADTFRMYEMFLGPVEASKPWDTKGIEGVHRFLRKLWRLFNDDIKGKVWNNDKPTDAELKILHRTIKKIEEDTEKFSFNTAVSAFMICVNDLFDVKCHKKEVLEKILILLVPYAPHIAEELWQQLGNEGTILDAAYPTFNPALLVESSKEYPVSINGKVRTNINLSLDLQQADVEKIITENEVVQKWLEGKEPKKIIYVKNKMINVVI
jgi:leucyl-tRNA synthetase